MVWHLILVSSESQVETCKLMHDSHGYNGQDTYEPRWWEEIRRGTRGKPASVFVELRVEMQITLV